MNIGIALLVIGLGAILRFAVHASVSGIDVGTVGLILMIVGGVGLVIGLGTLIANGRASDPSM